MTPSRSKITVRIPTAPTISPILGVKERDEAATRHGAPHPAHDARVAPPPPPGAVLLLRAAPRIFRTVPPGKEPARVLDGQPPTDPRAVMRPAGTGAAPPARPRGAARGALRRGGPAL